MTQIDPTPQPEKASSRSRRWVWLAGIAVVVLLTGILFFLPNSAPEPDVVWLNEAPFTRPLRGNLLIRLKNDIRRASGPVWQWLQPNPTTIELHSKLLACSSGALEGLQTAGFPSALATNADGVRLWVLSPPAATLLWSNLQSGGAYLLNDGHVMGSDGVRKRIYGGRATSTITNGMPLVWSIDFVPKIIHGPFAVNMVTDASNQGTVTNSPASFSLKSVSVGGAVSLTEGITSTEILAPTTRFPPSVGTNLFAACRTLVPNGGALLLVGNKTNADGRTYWVLTTSIAVDAKGNPLKFDKLRNQ